VDCTASGEFLVISFARSIAVGRTLSAGTTVLTLYDNISSATVKLMARPEKNHSLRDVSKSNTATPNKPDQVND